MTAPVDVDSFVVITRRTAEQFGAFGVDVVNRGALEVTRHARLAVQAMLGPDQRLSGYRYTPKGAKAKPRRINPYYRQATAATNPTALCAVRGPAQLIEHARRGGYTIRPRRVRVQLPANAATTAVERLQARLGMPVAEARAAVTRATHTPALALPGGVYRTSVKGGAIHRTAGPITRTFRDAPRIIQAAAQDEWSRRQARYLDDLRRFAGRR